MIFKNHIKNYNSKEKNTAICDYFGGPRMLAVRRRELLPFLSGLRFILEHSVEALESILAFRYECFDPQVGDNSCQLRAVLVPLLLQYENENRSLLISAKEDAQRSLTELIKHQKDLLSGNVETLPETFVSLVSNLKYSATLDALLGCFFLSKYEVYEFNLTNVREGPARYLFDASVDTGKLKALLGASKMRTLQFHFQRRISSFSVYICEIIYSEEVLSKFQASLFVSRKSNMDRYSNNRYSDILEPLVDSNQFVQKDRLEIASDGYGRLCTPCFESFEITVSLLKKTRLPMAVTVLPVSPNGKAHDPLVYFFVLDEFASEYRLLSDIEAANLDAAQPCFQMDSYYYLENDRRPKSQIVAAMRKLSIFKYLMHFGASHPVYPRNFNLDQASECTANQPETRGRPATVYGCFWREACAKSSKDLREVFLEEAKASNVPAGDENARYVAFHMHCSSIASVRKAEYLLFSHISTKQPKHVRFSFVKDRFEVPTLS